MAVNLASAPIIVFGAPRSGTTYLNPVLNQHPDIYITHETRVFAWLHRSLNVLTRNDQLLFTERERFIQELRSVFPGLIRDFYRNLQPHAAYWGDKNPHYADPLNQGCLETIHELFPGTRFLHILRDGREVVASLIRKQDAEGRPWIDFDGAHQVWTSHVDIGCSFGRSLPADQYFELRYEDLIADDARVARALFEFLRIDFHPQVKSFCEAQQQERTPLSGPTRDLRQGAALCAWCEVLAPEQQERSLQLLRDHLARYGYPVPGGSGERRGGCEPSSPSPRSPIAGNYANL